MGRQAREGPSHSFNVNVFPETGLRDVGACLKPGNDAALTDTGLELFTKKTSYQQVVA